MPISHGWRRWTLRRSSTCVGRVERERSPSRRWEGFAASVIENDDHDEGSESWDSFMAGWDMEAESYRQFLLRYYEEAPHLPRLIDLFTRYFDTLATSDGAVIVHCAAGKDRTGLAVALTHHIAGVHRDDIIADYLLTNNSGRFEQHGAAWREMILQQHGRAPDDGDDAFDHGRRAGFSRAFVRRDDGAQWRHRCVSAR